MVYHLLYTYFLIVTTTELLYTKYKSAEFSIERSIRIESSVVAISKLQSNAGTTSHLLFQSITAATSVLSSITSKLQLATVSDIIATNTLSRKGMPFFGF